jgi:signal transduction histidine kinase
MDKPVNRPRSERDATDESLSAERKNLDAVIGEGRREESDAADEVVERARERADAVLDTARDRADDGDDREAVTGHELAQRRRLEDEALRAERAAADERLRREREEAARTLAALLPLEREKTDRHLFSERARSDESLANRDDFLAMVGHDLRNLLSGIVLDAILVAERASDSAEGHATVAGMLRIQRYAARMNRLIGDLADVVAIDAGKLAIHKAPYDAVTLLSEAADAFAPSAADKGIALEVELPDGPLMVALDHERMLQVLANLVTNALKFTSRGGRVVLAGGRRPGEVLLSVSDTGSGIAADQLAAVFERFWQAAASDRRGLGLGLYISRSLVEAHGGRIWVESEPGAGSTFYVSVPG